MTGKTRKRTYGNYIGGKWRRSKAGNYIKQRNPANLSQVTSLFPLCSEEDYCKAVEAASEAFPGWSRLTVDERSRVLRRVLALMRERADLIAGSITLQNGKMLKESRSEVSSAMAEMEFQIEQGLRAFGKTKPPRLGAASEYCVRMPLGVVVAITPWNFPFNVPTRKCVPALMAGNTVILKPATLTPLVGFEFTKLFEDAGLPPGVLNFVTGRGSDFGRVVLSHPFVRAVSFTGSTSVGKRINALAARNMVRCQLEMGGKNALVVLEDADMEAALDAAALGAFACAGQWCTSTSRLILPRAIADSFVGRLARRAEDIKVGDGLDGSTEMGPVCGVEQEKSILKYINLGMKEGAELVCGGTKLRGGSYDKGCFIAPTIFDHVRPNMRIAREEIFGPVLCVIRVSDFEEACCVTNDTPYGLSSSIYTNDPARATCFVEKVETGLTHVNMHTAYKKPALPFGGIKQSGAGIPEAGHTGLEFFTDLKSVYVKPGSGKSG